MAGLESIALAVAHLERLQEEQEKAQQQGAPAASLLGKETTIAPRPTKFTGSARLVSSEFPSGSENQNKSDIVYLQAGRAFSFATPVNQYQAPLETRHIVQPLPSDNSTGSQQVIAKPVHTTEVGKLLHLISKVTDGLDHFFDLMKQLEDLAGGSFEKIIPDTQKPVFQVGRSDVLLGRGGETNHHIGNIQYRQLVKACQGAYLAAKRRDKPKIAFAIVRVVRCRNGRFLRKEVDSWLDVGNTRAREKTSQALREGAPELRSTIKTTSDSPSAAPEAEGPVSPTLLYHHPPALEQVHHSLTSVPVYYQVVREIYSDPSCSNKKSPASTSPQPSPKKRKLPATAETENDSMATTVSTAASSEDSESERSKGPRIKFLKKRVSQIDHTA
jgi:hypothetical protein